MSSVLKSIAKKLKKNELIFEEDMYSNIFGSIAICAYILAEDRGSFDIKDINKKYKSILRKRQTPVALNDPDFVNKVLEYYKIKECPKMDQLALVVYKSNAVIVPYINEQVFALREDGFIGNIISKGKIYPLCDASVTEQLNNISEINS